MVILKCVISNTVDKPPYVTWYLNNKVKSRERSFQKQRFRIEMSLKILEEKAK